VSSRRQRLRSAHLYLICDGQPDRFLDAALRGGVDMVQLRMKSADDEAIVAAARRFERLCAAYGALFILNDRPDLVAAAAADGVHVGQDDVPPAQARQTVGPELLVGLSTHSPEQVEIAGETDVDYIGVGPVYQTPTKPGRPAVSVELVRYAAAHSPVPFFAIGGISSNNIAQVRGAGATRVAVVRALTEAADPESAGRELRQGLGLAVERREAPVGPRSGEARVGSA
jgi:thiamine-phosphate pyrophosphorylase